MGGGDLNMKKSWHPLLLKNQERVWLEEKKALEEKKKLDQLRKEKEEERQLQELQRLQEEQTGRKRTEKLEWMYTTPATGSSQNANDLEDYLLGKKRVDKILTADENEKLGAAHKNFIAVQNANNARDTAAKIREDPLFAIKQQEAAALEALKSNPLRLREMQQRNGIKPKKDKKDKKREKKEKKEQRRRDRGDRGRAADSPPRSDYDDRDHHYPRRRSLSPRDRPRSRSPYRPRPHSNHEHARRDDDYSRRYRSRSRTPDAQYRRRPRSPSHERRRDDVDRRTPPWTRSDESPSPRGHDDRRGRSRSRSRSRLRERSPRHRGDDGPKRYRSQSPRHPDASYSKRARLGPQTPPRPAPSSLPSRSTQPPSRAPNPNPQPPSTSADDRAARLAAMSSNAVGLSTDRKERLTLLLEKEKAELEEDERLRVKSKGMSSFLSREQKKAFSGEGGLEDRLRRGRAGLVSEAVG